MAGLETPSRLTEPEETDVCEDCEEDPCECDWGSYAADMQYDAMKDDGY